jgi:hypothetical protein
MTTRTDQERKAIRLGLLMLLALGLTIAAHVIASAL